VSRWCTAALGMHQCEAQRRKPGEVAMDRLSLRIVGSSPKAKMCMEEYELLRSGRARRCLTTPVSRGSSSAPWSLPRADGASGIAHRNVQCHRGANERLQRFFINPVALMEIDSTPRIAFEAGVEEA
jgi:hypothetical protein